MLIENGEGLALPCNVGSEESVKVMVLTLESDLVDMRPDLLAALNVVLRCHGFSPVLNSQFWKSAEYGPSALVDTLIRDPDYRSIADRSDLIAIQLWNVFLMRECRSSMLMPQAAALRQPFESDAARILVKSVYPVDFVQAILERFGFAQCSAITPQCGEQVDSLRYAWHTGEARLRCPGMPAPNTRAETSALLQDAA
ncbi:MAG TPA: hypothetical protein VEG25_05965 [Burkholderiales bacterium]|nr:hypothetical protein [Burkholderiales bacterium]